MTAPLGRERTPGEIEEAIFDMALRGWSVAQIEQALPSVVKDLAKKHRWKAWKVPSKRTVQRIHKRARGNDSSEVWTVRTSPPSEARLILDFLAEAIQSTDGKIRQITVGDAELIVRIRSVAPLPFLETTRLAREYQIREERNLTTADFDGFLAFAPWKSRDAAADYYIAVLKKHIPPAEQWLIKTFPSLEWFGFEVAAAVRIDHPAIASGMLNSVFAIPYKDSAKLPSRTPDALIAHLKQIKEMNSDV